MCFGTKRKNYNTCSAFFSLNVLVINQNMKRSILVFLVIASLLVSCDKDKITSLSGTYSGRFIYTNPVSSVAPRPSGIVSVSFTGNNYSSTGNKNKIPAGGSGTFEIINPNKVRFHDVNIWTAEFDWGLVLSGDYTCKMKGDSLFMTKHSQSQIIYEYRLKYVGN
jgi:hypothetical protein